jgi:hypothetical protein
MATLGKFAAEYPGPEVLARNDRNDQWRHELSQQVRGSMIGVRVISTGLGNGGEEDGSVTVTFLSCLHFKGGNRINLV